MILTNQQKVAVLSAIRNSNIKNDLRDDYIQEVENDIETRIARRGLIDLMKNYIKKVEERQHFLSNLPFISNSGIHVDAYINDLKKALVAITPPVKYLIKYSLLINGNEHPRTWIAENFTSPELAKEGLNTKVKEVLQDEYDLHITSITEITP